MAIVGRPGADDTNALLAQVWAPTSPTVLAAAAPDDTAATGEVPLLADRPALEGRATCTSANTCQRPVTEPAELAAQLA